MSGAGWTLKSGEININADLKDSISHFFSKGNTMKNFYKLLFFKSLIDIEETNGDIFYETVICFSELYFNYKKEYPLNITLYNGRSKKSSVDILVESFFNRGVFNYQEILPDEKVEYILAVKEVLKKNVIGAFYKSLNEIPYSFNIKLECLSLNDEFKQFLNKNKKILDELIFWRIIEFVKISEKDEVVLEKELLKKDILDYKQDFYIQIKNTIDILFD